MTSKEVIFSSKLHKELITEFIEDVYRFTESANVTDNQLKHFSLIVNDIISASNNFYLEIDESFNNGTEKQMFMNEWVYKIPTSLLYATLGFYAGIRKPHNEDLLNETTQATICSFNHIYNKLEEVIDINNLLDNIHLN